jgi:hypothetical protein
MKCWLNDPLPIQWMYLSKEQKKQLIKKMQSEDVKFLKRMREIFNSIVLELEIHETMD